LQLSLVLAEIMKK